MARVEEMMRKFGINEHRVRLWIKGSDPEVALLVKKLAFDAAFEIVTHKGDKASEGRRIAVAIAWIKNVNAVEVLDLHGDGDLIYPEWP